MDFKSKFLTGCVITILVLLVIVWYLYTELKKYRENSNYQNNDSENNSENDIKKHSKNVFRKPHFNSAIAEEDDVADVVAEYILLKISHSYLYSY